MHHPKVSTDLSHDGYVPFVQFRKITAEVMEVLHGIHSFLPLLHNICPDLKSRYTATIYRHVGEMLKLIHESRGHVCMRLMRIVESRLDVEV